MCVSVGSVIEVRDQMIFPVFYLCALLEPDR